MPVLVNSMIAIFNSYFKRSADILCTRPSLTLFLLFPSVERENELYLVLLCTSIHEKRIVILSGQDVYYLYYVKLPFETPRANFDARTTSIEERRGERERGQRGSR